MSTKLVKNDLNDSDTESLFERLKKFQAKAPTSEEQFYHESFDIFSKLVDNQHIHNTDDSDLILQYMDLTYDYAETSRYTCIWDLVEKLHMNRQDYASDLSDWLNTYYPVNEVDDWKACEAHLLRGNFDEVIQLLESMNSTESTIQNIIDLIQEFQDIRTYIDQETLYKQKWAAWHETCQTKADKSDSDDIDTSSLFDILKGDKDYMTYHPDFFEKIIGHLLFVRPLISTASLNRLSQDMKFEESNADKVKEVCVCLVRGCFDDALDLMPEDEWLKTHLGHVLLVLGVYHTSQPGLTRINDQEAIVDPVYYAIQRYAYRIAEEYNMWNEAIAYLGACSYNREIWVIQLLESLSLPSKDMEQLESALETANKHDMPQVAKFIHRSMGQRYEADKKLKQATIEYGKANDLKSLDRISHSEFNEYLKTGKLGEVVTDMEELNSSPHYAVLIKYRQFKDGLENKQWKEASRILLKLLKNKHLPPKFEIVLLIDSLKILEETEHYYVYDEVIQLLDLFKHVLNSGHQEFISKYYAYDNDPKLSTEIVTSKLRERLAYKAATAPAS